MGKQDNEDEPSAAAPLDPSGVGSSSSLERGPVLVVGVGASAGGLDAFRAFFSAMAPDTGMSFILVQHLDPNHDSALSEILRRSTRMTISEAVDGDAVAPNHIHIIPPNATLTIKAGILRVGHRASTALRRTSVDIFMISLAEDQGANAVGIILSGFGSDGMLGMEAIKEHGGLTLAQAEFDHAAKPGMPGSAVSGGHVDHVLPVEKMPEVLSDYRAYRERIDLAKENRDFRRNVETHLSAICAVLDSRVGRDFSQYKTNTLMRRIQRRMQVLRIDEVADYVEHLRQRADEPALLFQELLIRVTRFFRDPAAFGALAERLPALLAREDGQDAIRVWVPGCATGEEAYSIAILLKEAMLGMDRSRRVQVFATDVDTQAIELARGGLYPDTLSDDVPADLLARYFNREGDGYRVSKSLREMCLFSIHDLVKDPPFSRLDLISCRNLLIYFTPELQKRVANRFHYGLVDSGILFLGISEAVTAHSGLFKPEDKKHRLFSRRQAPAQLLDIAMQTRRTAGAGAGAEKRTGGMDARIAKVMARYTPAFAVLDGRLNILLLSGSIGKYLAPPGGVASLNLPALIHSGLIAPLHAALAQINTGQRHARREGLAIDIGGRRETLTMDVELLDPPDSRGGGRIMVSLQDLGAFRDAGAPEGAPAGETPALDELIATRERLQTLTEELEASTEELQSSNEEYQSINEELQSANEELETSGEELQSVNEELATLNAELSTRNESLLDLNNDLVNLIDSTSIATLFLDRDFRIKRFTPVLLDLFSVREGDQGRPISDIVSKLAEKGLQADAEQVLRTLEPVQREVALESGERAYQMQIRPYRDADGIVRGVVVTFVDVTERKRVEFDRAQLAAIVSSSEDAIIGHDLGGTITSWNGGAERLMGFEAAEMVGGPMAALFPEARLAEEHGILSRLARGESISHHETVLRGKDGREVDVSQSISPMRGAKGEIVGVARILRDNTARRRADAEKALLLGELDHRVKNILATVSAIVRQTLHNSASPELFVKSIEGRIQALTRAHGLLTRDGTGEGSLSILLVTELAPYDDKVGRLHIEGPEILLTPKAGLVMAMAIHELATNAAKHGALSVETGRLSVTWRIAAAADGDVLSLDWRERDGPPVESPRRVGFGSTLIERALKYEFDAEVTRTFAPGGLRCLMQLPFTDEIARIALPEALEAAHE